MIEKIDHADIVPKEVIIAKLNKMIDEVNFLSKAMEKVFTKETLNEIRNSINE